MTKQKAIFLDRDGVLTNDDADYIAQCQMAFEGDDCGWDWMDGTSFEITEFTIQACACDVTGNDGISAVDASQVGQTVTSGFNYYRSDGSCQELSSMSFCKVGDVCDYCPPGKNCS